MHPAIKTEIMNRLEAFYDSHWYVLGQYVKDFEKEYANYNNTKYCIGVANGLDALHIALKALGVGPGDEVIVPSNTYIATWLAVSYVGATIVPVEPNPKTFNLDPDKFKNAITEKTKAVMPVHLYGQSCEMDRIMAIAKANNIFVVEDNAQSQGARCEGQLTGSFGQVNGVSFYPGKNLGALGDAGGITTDDEELDLKCRTIRNYGSQKKYYNKIIGINSRLDEAHAATLLVKLPHLDAWNAERVRIADQYRKHLQGIEGIILPFIASQVTSVYHQFIIRHQRRDELQTYLKENGIGTLIHYPVPPHLQEAYSHLNFKAGDFPIAEELAQTMLSLPIYPGLSEKEVAYIAEKVKEFTFKA